MNESGLHLRQYEVKVTPQYSVKRLQRLAEELNLEKFHIISKNYADLENSMYPKLDNIESFFS